MYAQRTFKFTIKNTSQIDLKYNFKIANSMTGILDAGPYSIMPKKGSIARAQEGIHSKGNIIHI